MINLYGIIGFIAFESIKIYKKLWSNKRLITKQNMAIYIIIIIVIAAFSGILAQTIANDNKVEAMFIGFSVPNNISVILHTIEKPTTSGTSFDNISFRENNLTDRIKLFIKLFFTI